MSKFFNWKYVWGMVALAAMPHICFSQLGARLKVDSLNQLAFGLAQQQPAEAMSLTHRALQLAERTRYLPGFSKAYMNLGIAFHTQSQYDSALHYYQKSLAVREKLRDTVGIASALNNIGTVSLVSGEYAQALEYYLRSLQLREQSKDSAGIAASVINLGNLYQKNRNFKEALKYYQRAYEFHRKSGHYEAMAGVLNNIAITYDLLKQRDKALKTHFEVLGLRRKLGDLPGLGVTYINIGELYKEQKQYDQAAAYYSKALPIKEQTGDRQGISILLNNLGIIARKKGRADEALHLQEQSLQLARSTGSMEDQRNALYEMAELFRLRNDYRQAFLAMKAYDQVSDSLSKSANLQMVASLQSRIQLQEKENTIRLLNQEKKISDLLISENQAQLTMRQNLIIFLITAALLGVGIVLVLVRSNKKQQVLYRILQENNHQIERQRDEVAAINKAINHQNQLLAQKNREITDSLNYARRIQNAIQPDEEQMARFFHDFFIINKPRDIVSGDFYWFQELGEGQALLAVGDCVGHGVPGAFMTVLATSLLNELVLERGLADLRLLMNEMHEQVQQAMHRGGDAHDTGSQLDLALIFIDKFARKVRVLSARMQVLTCTALAVETCASGRQSVGMPAFNAENFELVELAPEQEEATWYYALSDGFADQFGGAEGKKFLTKNLRRVLAENAHLPGTQQRQALLGHFDDWKGNLPQTDDVMVFGFRL